MKDFKKYYIIDAEPEMVYMALTNAATIRLWTGADAIMEPTEGSEFSLWDDNIAGKNISFIPGKKIVQEWYFGETDDLSIVTITLHEKEGKTSAELRHTNIPDEAYEEICNGWTNTYFASLIDFYKD